MRAPHSPAARPASARRSWKSSAPPSRACPTTGRLRCKEVRKRIPKRRLSSCLPPGTFDDCHILVPRGSTTMNATFAGVLAVLSFLASDRRELSGLIEDSTGKPLPGVTIWLSAGWRLDGTTPALGRATTDGGGRFAVPVPAGVPRPGPSLEMLSVWAYQRGTAPGRIHVTLSSESDREEIRLALPPARTRRLNLLRPDGKPLQGALVIPSAMGPSNEAILRYYLGVPDELADQIALRTDQEGKVEIPYLGE